MKEARRSFHSFYAQMLGDRWPALETALGEANRTVAYDRGLLKAYHLDPASIVAAEAAGPIGDGEALDLCAAPGGKSLILAAGMGGQGRLTANERSSARRARLVRVLDEYLAPELRARVRVTGHDAARWGLHEKNRYDLVLLDAPCSSERHLVHQPRYLRDWSPARTRRLAQQAYAMLLAAVDAAKVNGRVLYATCAISPIENDDVVERVLNRRPQQLERLNLDTVAVPEGAERTTHGRRIWPDRTGGWGPMYFSLLRKLRES